MGSPQLSSGPKDFSRLHRDWRPLELLPRADGKQTSRLVDPDQMECIRLREVMLDSKIGYIRCIGFTAPAIPRLLRTVWSAGNELTVANYKWGRKQVRPIDDATGTRPREKAKVKKASSTQKYVRIVSVIISVLFALRTIPVRCLLIFFNWLTRSLADGLRSCLSCL